MCDASISGTTETGGVKLYTCNILNEDFRKLCCIVTLASGVDVAMKMFIDKV